MNFLAFDTATEACSCALFYRGEICERSEFAPRRHAELILPMAESLLAEAGISPSQLDGVAFGRGPGSFTGLRIASGVAQGIAGALDLPVAPVSTLAALAQGAWLEHQARQVLAAIDARMSEMYWGIYQLDASGLMSGEDMLTSAAAAPLPAEGMWLGTGSGWDVYSETLNARFAPQLSGFLLGQYPQARHLVPLAQAIFQSGQAVSAEQALPVYLRNQVTSLRR